MRVTCDKNRIAVELNGDAGDARWTWTNGPRRTSGPTARTTSSTWPIKDHPRQGYIGLQDHGGDCWYKNIKLKPLAR